MAAEAPANQERRPSSRPSSREPKGGADYDGSVANTVSSVPVLPGRLGAYDVQKAVGKGGYAVVYKGVRHEDGRVVAIKKVEVFEMSQKKRERCLQEVTLLAQLHHPNIIQMLDAFIDENMLIIVFEWAPAGDLKRLIKKTAEQGKTLDEAAIWNFFMQIVDGLRYMHQHRIMHRDIKPANVLVGANGALKLGDLGLGRQLSEQTMEAFSKVGTPYYVSPEVVRGAGYDWKSDVWSMGCLLYELACLRSPFEMEGANLYDVFQKISKGEFEPIPADHFSAPLRQLVARMLQIEPAKRPELEEVWNIANSVVQAQSTTKRDTHGMAMELYDQLVLLEAELIAAASGTSTGESRSRPGSSNAGPNNTATSKRAAIAAAAAAPPPSDTLRLTHPLYFAEPLVPPLRPDADAFQKQQLGVVMHVFAWLLKLNGKADQAAVVESLLEFQPSGRASMQRAVTPSRSMGRSKSNGRSASKAGSSQAQMPVCTNVLKGAEAVKKGLQVLSISTEFAPVNALALGHGRTVCAVLQDTLAATLQRLPLTVRPIQRPLEAAAEEVADMDAMELEGGEADIATAPPPRAAGDTDDDEDEAYFADVQRARESLAPGGASSSGSGAAGGASGRRAERATAVQQHVDPVAWRAELERLTPALSRIKVAATDANSEWAMRWSRVKESLAALGSEAPPAVAGLGKLRSCVESDLDRIATSEGRLNSNCEELLGKYAASVRQLREVEADRSSHDELVGMGHAALAQLNEQIEYVQGQIQERTEQLDGTLQVKSMRDAISKLGKEIRQLDVRIGVAQNALMARQRRAMVGGAMGEGLAAEDGDDVQGDVGDKGHAGKGRKR